LNDEIIKATAIVYLAGYAAEKIYNPSQEPTGYDSDWEQAKSDLKYLKIPIALNDLLPPTFQLIKQLWSAIDLVAKEVYKQKIIKGLDFEILIVKIDQVLGYIDEEEAQISISRLEHIKANKSKNQE